MSRCENLPELPNVFRLGFLFSAATEAEPPGSTSATLDCDKPVLLNSRRNANPFYFHNHILLNQTNQFPMHKIMSYVVKLKLKTLKSEVS